MHIKFDLNGRNRKELVKAISEILSIKAIYKFMPTCAFEIGEFTVTKECTLEFSDSTDSDSVKRLIDSLSQKGFVAVNNDFYLKSEKLSEESETKPHSPTQGKTSATEESDDEEFHLTVSMPRDFFDDAVFGKLNRLIESKAELFKKAFVTDSLEYEVTDTEVRFPWFSMFSDDIESNAYCEFIYAFCTMAKEQNRINKLQTQTDNPKFAMRVFLIRLGFVGDEYKEIRRILLKNLSGSAAYRRKDTTVCSAED